MPYIPFSLTVCTLFMHIIYKCEQILGWLQKAWCDFGVSECVSVELRSKDARASRKQQPVPRTEPLCCFLQLIFSGEYTKAMNKDWHSSHFCCWQCDESLTGNRYVLRDDHPYCIKCYESVFANQCEECNKTIGIDSKVRHAKMLILFNAKGKIGGPDICMKF